MPFRDPTIRPDIARVLEAMEIKAILNNYDYELHFTNGMSARFYKDGIDVLIDNATKRMSKGDYTVRTCLEPITVHNFEIWFIEYYIFIQGKGFPPVFNSKKTQSTRRGPQSAQGKEFWKDPNSWMNAEDKYDEDYKFFKSARDKQKHSTFGHFEDILKEFEEMRRKADNKSSGFGQEEFYDRFKSSKTFQPSSIGPNSPYLILGITITATPDQIKKAYRDKMKEWHPDTTTHPKNQALAMCQKITEAYTILKKGGKTT